MKKLSMVAMVAGVGVYLGSMTAAPAAPITYDLIGVSAYFAPYFTDTLTGTFTFDPSTDITDSANIEVSGPVIPGTYNRGLQLYPLNSIIQADGATPGPTSAQAVILFFSASLGNTPDDVYQIGFGYPVDNVCCTWTYVNFAAVTGEAVPETPIPAALPLFATGLGAMGLIGWRRKRKAGAILAAPWIKTPKSERTNP